MDKVVDGDHHGLHFTYDERNLPVEIGGFSYRYNADGHRYLSDVGGTQTFYVMDGTRNVGVFRTNSTGQWELRYWNIFGNGLEGRREEGTEHRFYHKDYLGSTRAVVNASGTIVGAYDYYPFGMELPGRSYTAGSPTHEKFIGHQRDEEVDLDYMIWRRYDPAFPVFLSVDPITNTRNPRELSEIHNGKHLWYSSYSYVFNDPVKYYDPDGLSACPPCGNIFVPNQLENMWFSVANTVNQKVSDVATHVESIPANVTGAVRNAWNSDITRDIIPDYLSIGVGFDGIGGVGGTTNVDANWVLFGDEASFAPVITVTQGVGGGVSMGGTVNFGAGDFLGPASQITREMLITNISSGDVTVFGSVGGGVYGGKIGVTGSVSPAGGSVILNRQLNVGGNVFPFNFKGGVSNTFLIHDFNKK